MKKRLTILLCSMTLVMSGCNNADKYKVNEGTQPSSNTEDTSDAVSNFPDYTYDQENAQIQRNIAMAIADDGYYYTANNVLYKYDINSDLVAPMCSNVVCKHRSKSCTAYVYSASDISINEQAWNCDGGEVFFYNDKIYMVERNDDIEYHLYQYDKNFNNKVSIAQLASYSSAEGMMLHNVRSSVISEGYLYYCNYYYDIEEVKKNKYEFTYNCMRVKLEEGATPEKLGSFEFGGDFGVYLGTDEGLNIFISGDDVYFVAGGTARMYTTVEPVQCRVLKYSKITKEFAQVWSYTGEDKFSMWGDKTTYVTSIITDDTFMDNSGNMYIITKVESSTPGNYKIGDIIKINFDTGKTEVVYEDTPERSVQDIAFDGQYLYAMVSENGEWLTAMDTEGNVISRYKIEHDEEYVAFLEERGILDHLPSGKISILGLDDRYIMIMSGATGYKGLSASTVNFPSQTPTCGIGLIDKAKFLSGEPQELKQIYQY